MKLYSFAPSPAGQRVRMFLVEKGLEVPTIELNVRADEQFKEPFTSMNPFHCVPFLQLDDGTVISETVSICRYLEEFNREPSLFGSDARERAIIDMWIRRVELDGYVPTLHAFRNHLPNFEGKVVPGTRTALAQLPAMVERGKQMLCVFLDRLDPQLAQHEFIAGDGISIADITAYYTVNMANALQVNIEGPYADVFRWHTEFSKRPSAQF
jgi:glutathione S-transferase